jgi:predicted RNA-binding protein with EMAP domain
MDTAKDARILVLEDALRRLHEIVGNRKLKIHIEYSKLSELIQQSGSLLYEVKYSYIPANQVASLEATQKIVENILAFKMLVDNALKSSGYKPSTTKESLNLAELQYAFRVVEGFQHKLRTYDDEPARAVDILVVEISQTQAVPDSKNLTECRCTDGHKIWKIVTNITGIKSGIKLACAVLPPVEMMDIVSEAMFLGGDPLSDDVELGLLENPAASLLDQARAQVLHIMKRMM